MDVDAAGGMVSAGLVAGAIERPTGHAGEAGHRCADCGAQVSSKFCPECGQPAHTHRTLLHLGEELLHGVMHFDARIWRTLPLLIINPGRLTREWVEGKRSRYISPLAIFLFTLFVMFFTLTFMPHHEGPALLPDKVAAERAAMIVAEQNLARTREEQAGDANSANANSANARAAIGVAEQALKMRQTQLARLEGDLAHGRADGLKPGSWQAVFKDGAAQARVHEGLGHGIGVTLLKKMQNSDLAFYKLQQTMYKFAFLLVPLSIPFMALLFLWKRGFTLYDQGVFVLYSLTFMAMLMMVMAVLGSVNMAIGGVAITLGMIVIPIHVFAQLKGAYSLSWFSALWRSVFLLAFCNIVVGLFVMAIVYLGLGH